MYFMVSENYIDVMLRLDAMREDGPLLKYYMDRRDNFLPGLIEIDGLTGLTGDEKKYLINDLLLDGTIGDMLIDDRFYPRVMNYLDYTSFTGIKEDLEYSGDINFARLSDLALDYESLK
ncbi:MAG: hypothetical protein ACI83O_000846 [Patescibacteria group bacterium]|jgi:hypothetical protein